MDCSPSRPSMTDAFQYVIDNGGQDTEASYPYTGERHSKCKFTPENVGAIISSFNNIKKGTEHHLEAAVATIGPISVAIDANSVNFQLYESGVYDEADCSSSVVNHGMLVVGYDVDSTSGQQYWIVKNSWGTTWGIGGYIQMSRHKHNQCGIATEASFPIV